MSSPPERDRDAAGRARNARARDDLGRPLDRGSAADAAPDLDDDVARPPGVALGRAQELLDAGQPFAAHEVLEAVWKSARDSERGLWRGLAQLAVGITHALRGNQTGAVSLLTRSADTLAPYDGTTPYSVAVADLRAWALAAAADVSLAANPPRLLT